MHSTTGLDPHFTRALADVVAHWVRQNPDLIGRLGRAHQLVLSGAVSAFPDRLCHSVRSSRGDRTYTACLTGRWCECPDFVGENAPRGWCKHLLAVAAGGAAMRLLDRRGLADGDLGAAAWSWRWLLANTQARQQEAVA